jgi:hypothetical protein
MDWEERVSSTSGSLKSGLEEVQKLIIVVREALDDLAHVFLPRMSMKYES